MAIENIRQSACKEKLYRQGHLYMGQVWSGKGEQPIEPDGLNRLRGESGLISEQNNRDIKGMVSYSV